jgi:CheY-like chemotaxis protein
MARIGGTERLVAIDPPSAAGGRRLARARVRYGESGGANGMKAAKILAVDDNYGNLLALDAVLGAEYEVVPAHSGQEALDLLRRHQDIALILMDVQMPEMDGFECAQRIKATPELREIPIVFVTAVYHEDPFIKHGYDVGGVDYFTKPFDPDLLKLKIKIYSSFRQKAELLRARELHVRESEEILETGRKLSSFLEGLPVGVLVADVSGRICQSNDELARIFRSSELVGHDEYGALLGWWDAGGHMIKDDNGPLARALLGHSARNLSLELLALDGTRVSLSCSASPLHGSRGEIAGAVIVLRDITEPRRIEKDFEDRVARLLSAGLQLEQSVHR